jgi:hypothetical protein
MLSQPDTNNVVRKILIDVNIFMDVLERRAGWLESAAVVAFCEDGFTGVNHAGDVLHGFVSALTPIIIYWLRSRAGRTETGARADAEEAIKYLEIVSIDGGILTQAFHSPMPDFEDNIQIYCAIACQADYIVTRNVGHFANSPVPAITPEDLLIEFGDRDV